MKSKGLLVVLSGPSGVGKGTVRKALFDTDHDRNQFFYSVSATTREARQGEVNGQDYFFVSRSKFEQMIEEEQLLEYAEYVGNYYGTPLAYIEDMTMQGKDVFLEIEVQGALQVKRRMPDGVFIFLAPPNLGELETRIVNRGTDAPDVIAKRMEQARAELQLMTQYDYVVENDDVSKAVENIQTIIQAEHLKVDRFIDDVVENYLDEGETD
ncbi:MULTISPECIES: guanylate kinase [Aerococcus]|uniref:Guanylate kinase n=1 Tax=Aerococcus sanguinicola TaxID=119206 RepID=A0A5N1GPZ6_9LACT|nr:MULTISPECIES: guanylate kinase [Aerococcus]KAA9300790.1 guanylate kinase [Aerococcus sanguinicola]MDK6369424.1 guanylate kinase [Aerococcus sp. UMB9870]MDK6680487.1 guanylate kinase [Aerococcus sp. UMB8608]MDK6686713.1 guanylate kinase [Aerococcus sp. UMB8623]MDK6940434.1 guanylate kinase [Aerococcus sp. UMB8487]